MVKARTGPLGVRAFRIFLVGRSVSFVGSSLIPVALAFAILEELSSPAALGAVLAAQAVPQVLFLLAGGVFSDRYSRRAMLFQSTLVMGAAQAVSGVLLVTGHGSVAALMLLQAVYGIARAVYSPATSGIVRELLPLEQVQGGVSLLSLARNSANIAGPILAGLLVATVGAGVAVLVDAATFFLSAVSLVRIGPLSGTGIGSQESFFRQLAEGWDAFRERSWVWSMVGSFSIYQAVVLPSIFVLGPTIALAEGLGSSGWSLVLAGQGGGAVLGALLVLKWRPARPLVASTLLVLVESGFLFALAAGAGVAILVPLAVAGSGGVVAADALWSATLQTQIPEHLISRISSFDWLGSLAMYPLGVAVAGILATRVDLGTLVVAAALINIAVRLVLLLSPGVRSIRSMTVTVT